MTKTLTIIYFEDIGVYLDDELVAHINENDTHEFPDILIGLMTEGVTNVVEVGVDDIENTDDFWNYISEEARWKLPNTLTEFREMFKYGD